MSDAPELKPEDLVACCGLYCDDCHAHTGIVADLARDLRKELRRYKYDKFAAELSKQSFAAAFKNYPQCYEVLGQMVKFRCRNACRGGGGPPFCKMRQCCEKKGYEGCWECPDFETCSKLDFLNGVHGDGHIKNLRILKKKGKEGFVNGKRNW